MALIDGSNVIIQENFETTNTTTNNTNAKTIDDDDLTNLTWLQDQNLLKNLRPSNESMNILRIFHEEDNDENVSPPQHDDVSVTVGDVSEDDDDDVENGNDENNSHGNPTTVPPVTYDPQLHRNAKPPYSFSSLIFMAIESSPNKALPVKDIYAWIVEHFPYYQTAPSGWKNTVRHNLSLNKCFRKLEKIKDDLIQIAGKGALWCVDPKLRPNLLQAIRRTPAHIYPYMSSAKPDSTDNSLVVPARVQLTSNNTTNNNSTNNNKSISQVKKALGIDQVQSVVNLPQPHLFPFLSKRLLIPITKLKKDKEADAAVSMLTLQCNVANNNNVDIVQQDENSSEILPDSYVDDLDAPVVTITVSPSSDHNYYNRKSSPQVYQVIHITNDQQETTTTTTPTTTSTNTTTITKDKDKNNDKNTNKQDKSKKSRKRKKSSSDEVVRADKEESEQSEDDDEGMRGAEALLNLATSNNNKQKQQSQQQQQQEQERKPLILKKAKKDAKKA